MTAALPPAKEQDIKLFPVQAQPSDRKKATCREDVYMAAYEVYCHVYSPQPAMIEGGCRGGFSSGELIAFLYARSFPKAEWSQRANAAFKGLNV